MRSFLVAGESKPELEKVRLVDVTENHIVELDLRENEWNYAALSYVWGPNTGQGQLRKRNTSAFVDSEGRKCRTLPGLLPAVVQDALVVTLQLGLRYLWVDIAKTRTGAYGNGPCNFESGLVIIF
jgi:hypothetical protein